MIQEKLYNLIKTALEVESITIDDSIDTVEAWDSLAQLSILVAIDQETEGRASKITELATALSVKKLIDILEKNDLISE
jgi:hypothetical protein